MPSVTLITPQTLATVVNAFALGDGVTISEALFVPDQRWWRVQTKHGDFMLRATLGEKPQAAAYEAAVLRQLGERALAVPMRVFPLVQPQVPEAPTARFELFVREPGRRLGAFEVEKHHLAQVGRVLAAIHLAGRGLPKRRMSPLGTKTTLGLLVDGAHARQLTASIGPHGRVLPTDYAALLQLVRNGQALMQKWPKNLPRGLIHGQPNLERFRFHEGKLTQIVDFSQAGIGPWLLDVGLAIGAFCFVKDTLDTTRLAPLIQGYEERRPLSRVERTHLLAVAKYALIADAARGMWQSHHALSPPELAHVVAKLQEIEKLEGVSFDDLMSKTYRQVG